MISIYKEATQFWIRNLDSEDGCAEKFYEYPPDEYESGGMGNFFVIKTGDVGSGSTAMSQVQLSIESNSVGIPIFCQYCPDGTEIVSAIAEITCSGLTRTKQHSIRGYDNCNGYQADVYETVTDVIGLSYTVVRFTSETDYVVVGSVPGAANGTRVANVKFWIEDIMANRSHGIPYGYGLAFFPDGVASAGSLLDQLPGEPEYRHLTICPGGICEGESRPEYYTWDADTISWGGATIGNVSIKIKYPDADQERCLIMPRFPSFKV